MTTNLDPLSRDDMKIVHFCDEGAPAVCPSCKDRRKCEFWNDHLHQAVFSVITEKARRVMDTPLREGLVRKKTMILYVRTIAKRVSNTTGEQRMYVYQVVTSVITNIKSCKVWGTGARKPQKERNASLIYSVKLEDIL